MEQLKKSKRCNGKWQGIHVLVATFLVIFHMIKEIAGKNKIQAAKLQGIKFQDWVYKQARNARPSTLEDCGHCRCRTQIDCTPPFFDSFKLLTVHLFFLLLRYAKALIC